MGFGKYLLGNGLFACGLAIAGLPGVSTAAVTLTQATYTQNFDGLAAGAVFPTTVGVVTPLSGTTGWDGTRLAGTSTSTTELKVNVLGGSSSSGLYAFAEDATGERSLGGIGSGLNAMGFGVALTNGTNQTLTNPTIQFHREQWRTSTVVKKTIAFAYGLNATESNYLTADLTSHTGLDLVGMNPTASVVTRNGNFESNRLLVQDTLTLSLLPGETLFLRWSDSSNAGSNGAVAIDDFSIAFIPVESEEETAVPEPGVITFALAGLLGLKRRRAITPR